MLRAVRVGPFIGVELAMAGMKETGLPSATSALKARVRQQMVGRVHDDQHGVLAEPLALVYRCVDRAHLARRRSAQKAAGCGRGSETRTRYAGVWEEHHTGDRVPNLPPGWPTQLAGCIGLALLDGAGWLWLAHVLTWGGALLTALLGVVLTTPLLPRDGHSSTLCPCFIPPGA